MPLNGTRESLATANKPLRNGLPVSTQPLVLCILIKTAIDKFLKFIIPQMPSLTTLRKHFYTTTIPSDCRSQHVKATVD